MSVSNSTHSKSAGKSRTPAETKTLDCYDRLVAQIATLECVLDTLVTHDLTGGLQGHIASAELVLRETIARLHDLTGDVETMQDRIATEVVHA